MTTTRTLPLTHYQVLEVSPDASIEEIKEAFRRIVLKCHPDKNPNASKENFRRIQQAWECLRDSRQPYDEELRRKATLERCKESSVMIISASETEEAVDDETGGVIHVYSCRCGDEVLFWSEDLVKGQESSTIRECPGCSFSYSIE
jgi:curved DNA-binding protein CbpA